MKHLSAVILGLVCLGLVASLFVSKSNDNAQHEKDAEAITSSSNLLSLAQTEVADCKGKMVTLSNRLETCQSTSLTFSNELIEAKSAHATAKEDLNRQINDLNQRITQSESEKQASSQHIADMANQIAELTNQIASVQASLLQASKDYALLENRFRRDVAERVIAERKFNNRSELKTQLEYLQWNPAREISEDRIREGLNVVVGKSNLCYVIAPE
jgi:predicted  nucleic acid-binding Zn-ribbon protein